MAIDPKILKMKPGPAKWKKLISLAEEAVGIVSQDRTDHFEEKSERWQNSDAGEAFSDITEKIGQIQSDLEDLYEE